MSDEQKILLKFKASQKSPVMEIGVGEYHRSFKADEQPFEVKDTEEERLLRNTGFFIGPDEEKEEQEQADKMQPAKSKVAGKIGGAPPAPAATDEASS